VITNLENISGKKKRNREEDTEKRRKWKGKRRTKKQNQSDFYMDDDKTGDNNTTSSSEHPRHSLTNIYNTLTTAKQLLVSNHLGHHLDKCQVTNTHKTQSTINKSLKTIIFQLVEKLNAIFQSVYSSIRKSISHNARI